MTSLHLSTTGCVGSKRRRRVGGILSGEDIDEDEEQDNDDNHHLQHFVKKGWTERDGTSSSNSNSRRQHLRVDAHRSRPGVGGNDAAEPKGFTYESIAKKKAILAKLRRKRIGLEAQVEVERERQQPQQQQVKKSGKTSAMTLEDRMVRRKIIEEELVRRPYLAMTPSLVGPKFQHQHEHQHRQQQSLNVVASGMGVMKSTDVGRNKTSVERKKCPTTDCADIHSKIEVEPTLEERWEKVRHNHKLSAAYRLAGISLLPKSSSSFAHSESTSWLHDNHTTNNQSCGRDTIEESFDDDDDDDDVLSIRFDVAVDGCYVDSHHVFFELVTLEIEQVGGTKAKVTGNKQRKQPSKGVANSSKKEGLYLRLVQHTIPPSVPLARIMKETLVAGGKQPDKGTGTNQALDDGDDDLERIQWGASIGIAYRVGSSVQDDHTWKVDDLQQRLRHFSSQLYRACYCFAARRHAHQCLLDITESTVSSPGQTSRSSHVRDGAQYSIQDLKSNASFDTISFRMEWCSGLEGSLAIKLEYQDAMQPRPTTVAVSNQTRVSKCCEHPEGSLESALGRKRKRCRPRRRQPQQRPVHSTEISDEECDNERAAQLIETIQHIFVSLPVQKAVVEAAIALTGYCRL